MSFISSYAILNENVLYKKSGDLSAIAMYADNHRNQ